MLFLPGVLQTTSTWLSQVLFLAPKHERDQPRWKRSIFCRFDSTADPPYKLGEPFWFRAGSRSVPERRGKRPINIAARRRRLVLQRKFKEALESNDVEVFEEAIINDLGWIPESPEYERALKVWYGHHGRS